MLRVLIIEDDSLTSGLLTSLFQREFNDVQIMVVASELQFEEDFDQIEDFGPHLILLDVMLRWSRARLNRSLTMPRDIKSTSFYRAGFRCLKSLSAKETFQDTPVIVHSVLGKADLTEELRDVPMNVFVCDKHESQLELFTYIRSLITDLPQELPKRKTILARLLDSSEIKAGWFGIRIDLKSLFKRQK